ncbi:MAG: hypothetical protein IJH60_04150, partial [Eubacterium sp.]|nr:hypothetical protein [Eubacterium sp.]
TLTALWKYNVTGRFEVAAPDTGLRVGSVSNSSQQVSGGAQSAAMAFTMTDVWRPGIFWFLCGTCL